MACFAFLPLRVVVTNHTYYNLLPKRDHATFRCLRSSWSPSKVSPQSVHCCRMTFLIGTLLGENVIRPLSHNLYHLHARLWVLNVSILCQLLRLQVGQENFFSPASSLAFCPSSTVSSLSRAACKPWYMSTSLEMRDTEYMAIFTTS